ncbi:protein YgfX [Ferrimonas lipolytica]|uniref:protein YgfX n=1 Tax=Ferrimonas lipolytica TaxID=2724191 RepID=UPI003B82CB7C
MLASLSWSLSEIVYSFRPHHSRLGQIWYWAATTFLVLLILSWPQQAALQPLLQAMLGLYVGYFRYHNRPKRLAAFTLEGNGRGRLLAAGEQFQLSVRTRLLPQVVVLHSEQLGWQWLWCDSIDDTHWRRLCRIALKAQRGESMVGAGSELNSG